MDHDAVSFSRRHTKFNGVLLVAVLLLVNQTSMTRLFLIKPIEEISNATVAASDDLTPSSSPLAFSSSLPTIPVQSRTVPPDDELLLFCSGCMFNQEGFNQEVTCLARAQYFMKKYNHTTFESKKKVMQIDSKNCIKQKPQIKNRLSSRERLFCNENDSKEWSLLCSRSFIQDLDSILISSQEEQQVLHIIQIGAHTGFEMNDPICKGMTRYLETLSPLQRQRLHWTFVEPSPANYKSLLSNTKKYSHLCNMSALNMAIVPDGIETGGSSNMTFYTIRETIDPVTGYDSLSGKKFPAWITQVSSFSKQPILFNKRVWRRLGLNVSDYIVETKVTTRGYTELVQQIMGTLPTFVPSNEQGQEKKNRPVLVLIDTEGFDCQIILGISSESTFLPKHLVYEHHQCGSQKVSTQNYLKDLGYQLSETKGQNTIASHEGFM